MNEEIVKRLSNYRRILYKLISLGFTNVYSDYLADALGTTPSQVRKDFSMFGLTGKTKGGYKASEILEKLNEIFGKNELQKIIVVGCGRMGKTLLNYSDYCLEGMKIVAGFDSSPSIVNPDSLIPVYDFQEVEKFIKKEKITMAIIAVPEASAFQTAEKLMECGIKGILNFAPIQLKSSKSCHIKNICILLELENLSFFINNGFNDKLN